MGQVKKQRTFWLDDRNWKKLQDKVAEQGLSGKGKLERFMEMICDNIVIFVKGSGKFEIKLLNGE